MSLLLYLWSCPILAQINTAAYRAAADIGLAGNLLHNPAQLGEQQRQVQCYSQILTGLPELNNYGFLWQGQRAGKNLGLALSQSGPNNYQNSALYLSFGLPISGKLALGLRLTIQRLEIVEQKTRYYVSNGFNWSYRLREDWCIAGALDYHPKQAEAWGLSVESKFKIAPNTKGLAAFRLKPKLGPQLAMALIMHVFEKLSFRQGLGLGQHLSYHGGLAYQFAKYQFAFSRVWQRALGWQESISLIYSW